MKWILVLIWSHNGAMMGAQFGPFSDKIGCEAVRKELVRDMQWSGAIRGACALSSIDPAKLPKVEVQNAPKAKE